MSKGLLKSCAAAVVQSLTSAASWKASQYTTVVSLAHTPQHHSEQFIRLLASAVQPGGRLILRQVRSAHLSAFVASIDIVVGLKSDNRAVA